MEYQKLWISKVKASENQKVIIMLSGGKDSIAAMLILKKAGIDVTAIHFFHKWGAKIPTEEAKRICKENSIPLIMIDYTTEFFDSIKGFTGGRPCAICKLQMYKILINKLSENKFGWLCIGDNQNDRTTIARIKKFIAAKKNDEDLECNNYFGSEMGIKLPNGMKVLRPLIRMKASDIETFLRENSVQIKRINSTGDKYFEYHREGCPIQFADIGIPITESLCDTLATYNEKITEFARNENILASIHLPSTFVVTIPRGYERKAIAYLEENNLSISRDVNSDSCTKKTEFIANLDFINESYFDDVVYKKVFARLLERLEFSDVKCMSSENDMFINLMASNEDSCIQVSIDKQRQKAFVHYLSCGQAKSLKDFGLFDNLILELFRTRRYSVKNISFGGK